LLTHYESITKKIENIYNECDFLLNARLE